MKNSNIDISIIMPIYNGERYLKEAIDSLRNQTKESFEILCVDDGSTDHTLELLKDYSLTDERIRVIEKQHEGAGAARNYGILHARGEYLLFLDGDDIFQEKMLEKIVEKGQKTQADILVFAARQYDNRTGKTREYPGCLKRELIPKKEVFFRRDMDGRILELTIPAPWTKAYRREFVLEEGLQYQNLPNSNDIYFAMTALAIAEKVTVIDSELLLYRVFREGSIQNQKYREPLCFLKAYRAVYDELIRRGIYGEVEKGFCQRVIVGCYYQMNSVKNEDARWEILRALCEESFTSMGILNHPDEFYQWPDEKNRLAGLPYAVEFHDILLKKKEKKQVRIIKKHAIDVKPKVSVIIPVYNTEDYLEECLSALQKQTLSEIEIICIDDGSTDRSLEIMETYAVNDERIAIYSQENSGQSAARNRGIELAVGEYIYFMDSDDYLVDNALEELYTRSKEKELDVLYFDGASFYEDEDMRADHPQLADRYTRKGKHPEACSGIEMYLSMKRVMEFRVIPGLQFYRRNFLVWNRISFEEGIIYEDNDFSYRAVLQAERAGYLNQVYFMRRVRANSTMTRKVEFEHAYGYYKTFMNMLFFVKGKGYSEEILVELYETMWGLLDLAKRQYVELPVAQKQAYLGLDCEDRFFFQMFIQKEDRLYADKKRLYDRLQETFAEKSEINRKLQITYGEKYDRGLEIKRLKKEIASIKKSRTYRLARIIGFPVRVVRKLRKSLKKEE